jgi:transcriptional regulator with XRE-family HTH domain
LQPLDAERVKEWRHRRMLSQQEVADRAGTSLFTIQRIERGEGNVRPKTGRGVAAALSIPIEELLPKAQAPLFQEPPEQESAEERRAVNDLEYKRALRYLGAWREFVWKQQAEWKEEPPKTSRDIAPLFNAMTALVDQGVFKLSNASSSLEHIELTLFMEGIKWLNAIADKVEADEEAEKRRAVLRVVEDQIGA